MVYVVRDVVVPVWGEGKGPATVSHVVVMQVLQHRFKWSSTVGDDDDDNYDDDYDDHDDDDIMVIMIMMMVTMGK